MTWNADSKNLLLVNDDRALPNFIGWWATSEPLTPSLRLTTTTSSTTGSRSVRLTTSAGITTGKGLTAGYVARSRTLRKGNGNGTITLSTGQTIITQISNGNGKYLDKMPTTPGNSYTFGVTTLGVNAAKYASTCTFKIIWVNATGVIISEVSQGMYVNFGQKIRNSATATAPANSVGAVVSIQTNKAVILSRPTFVAGNTDLTFGPAVVANSVPSSNIFIYTAEDGSSPWETGWSDEYHKPIAPVNGFLTVKGGGEARLYHQENPEMPGTLGISVTPGSSYNFELTEYPVKTQDSSIILRLYNSTGTEIVAEQTASVLDNKFYKLIDVPVNAAYLAIKILNGANDTQFTTPKLVSTAVTTPDPLGTVSMSIGLISDVNAFVGNSHVLSSNTNSRVNKSTVLQSDLYQLSGIGSTVLQSDINQLVSQNLVLSSDTNTNVRQSVVSISDTRQTVSDAIRLVSDINQVVRTTYDLRTDTNVPVYAFSVLQSDTRANVSQSTELRSDANQTVGTSHILLSEVLEHVFVSTSHVLSSDVFGLAGKTTRLDSDVNQVVKASVALNSDTSENVRRVYESISDVSQLAGNTTQFISDNRAIVGRIDQFNSDTNQLVRRGVWFISAVNRRKTRMAMTSRPTDSVGTI